MKKKHFPLCIVGRTWEREATQEKQALRKRGMGTLCARRGTPLLGTSARGLAPLLRRWPASPTGVTGQSSTLLISQPVVSNPQYTEVPKLHSCLQQDLQHAERLCRENYLQCIQDTADTFPAL